MNQNPDWRGPPPPAIHRPTYVPLPPPPDDADKRHLNLGCVIAAILGIIVLLLGLCFVNELVGALGDLFKTGRYYSDEERSRGLMVLLVIGITLVGIVAILRVTQRG